MIVELLDTTTTAVNKKLDALREEAGVVTMGRVGTLIIRTDTTSCSKSRSRPPMPPRTSTRVGSSWWRPGTPTPQSPVWMPRFGSVAMPAAGRSWCYGSPGRWPIMPKALSRPFLLPDIPVLHGGRALRRRCPRKTRLGKLAIRRITDATNGEDPLAAIKGRLSGYTAGDTESGLGPHHLLAGAARLGGRSEAARADRIGAGFRIAGRTRSGRSGGLAGQLHRRPGTPGVGELKVELERKSETITLSRPQEGTTATLSRTGRPDALVPLARRETR